MDFFINTHTRGLELTDFNLQHVSLWLYRILLIFVVVKEDDETS